MNTLLWQLVENAVAHVEQLDSDLMDLTNRHADMQHGTVTLSSGSVWYDGSYATQGEAHNGDGDNRVILFACRKFASQLHDQITVAKSAAAEVEQWAAEIAEDKSAG